MATRMAKSRISFISTLNISSLSRCAETHLKGYTVFCAAAIKTEREHSRRGCEGRSFDRDSFSRLEWNQGVVARDHPAGARCYSGIRLFAKSCWSRPGARTQQPAGLDYFRYPQSFFPRS